MYKGAPLLKQYKNGNYYVRIFSDGTKERFSLEDEFKAEFPESIDLKITNYCDLNCPMCHESSSLEGEHANLDADFIKTLTPGIELAIGGGNPLSHPDLLPFLKRLKEQGIISNLTINERHLLTNLDLVKQLLDEQLIYGLGISLNKYDEKTFEFAKIYSNVVFHMILGIIDIDRLINFPKGFKALFLGYKRFGRGEGFYHDEIGIKIKDFENNFMKFKNNFKIIAFDNLALEQIHMKKHLPSHIYDKYYMGDDGEETMYIDLVKREFAKSSTSKNRYELLDDIKDMLSFLKNNQ